MSPKAVAANQVIVMFREAAFAFVLRRWQLRRYRAVHRRDRRAALRRPCLDRRQAPPLIGARAARYLPDALS